VLFAVMALMLFVYYPLTHKKVAELQEQKERKLREHFENNSIDI
jgi:Na+/melibiose symporter-like transporter